MAETLAKGGNLLLASEAPGIEQVRIGIGWQSGSGTAAVEIDGLLSLVEQDARSGRLLLAHQVPNRDESVGATPATGPVVGDAERLVVTLASVPASVNRLQFGATIYDADARRQTFRSVRGAYIRVLNHANGIEIARYTLDVETGSETAMVFGELYRNPRGWKFRAVGQGYAAGLRGIAGGSGDPQTARPVEVTDYLRRLSPARSRRSFAEHLDPPRAAPAVPAAEPQKASRQQTSGTSTPTPAPARAATPSAAPAMKPPSTPPAAKPPTPPVAQPAARPAAASPARVLPAESSPPAVASAGRSLLDLSGDEPAASSAPAAPAPTPAPARPSSRPSSPPPSSPNASAPGSTGAQIEYGEQSSRHRQRMEHVAALDDGHPATTWTESDRGTGGMTITLRWEPLTTSSGLPRPSDLHLAAFWQGNDRTVGLMHTLGGAISAPGAAGPRQVLRLGRRDEREGQTIFVDLATLPTFKRFFVFAYGQHGSPEWPVLRPVLTVTAPSGEQLTMRLGDAPPGARLCVVASFHVVQGDLVLRREDDFVTGMPSDAASRYGFDLDWNPEGLTLRSEPSVRTRH